MNRGQSPKKSDQRRALSCQCAARYASTMVPGMRPRSETVYPLAFAHSRIAAVSGEPAARLRGAPVRDDVDDERRAAEMYGSSASRNATAFSEVRSISYAVLFTEKWTVSPS